MDEVSCPNCGYGFPALLQATRMFDCPSCGTTLFRDDSGLSQGGDHGEMFETDMLFKLGDTVFVHDQGYLAVGHARFDYGRGWWDEFWAIDGAGGGMWISVDEGDVVAQEAIAPGNWPRSDRRDIGASVYLQSEVYVITEAESATCVAIRGEFPEQLEIGESHQFINASAPGGVLLSGEFWDGGEAWFQGFWLDPYELKVVRG